MTQSHGTQATSAVLGVTVVGDEVASVILGVDGQVLANNVVDLPDASSDEASTVISELVDSVPYAVDQVVVACASPDTQAHLRSTFVPDPSATWYGHFIVGDLAPALAQVARTEPDPGGPVAVVNLDRYGALSEGTAVVVADPVSGDTIGSSEASDRDAAVTDPAAAAALADVIANIPGGAPVTGVLCTGTGADLPDIAPSVEEAVQRPVRIAQMSSLAAAIGATRLLSEGHSSNGIHGSVMPAAGGHGWGGSGAGARWWLVGAGVAVAVAFGVGGLAYGLTASNSSDKNATSTSATSTVTVTGSPAPQRTVTDRETAAPQTRTRVQTTTVTQPGGPGQTRTITAPAPPPVTETETTVETTVVTTTVSVPGQSDGTAG